MTPPLGREGKEGEGVGRGAGGRREGGKVDDWLGCVISLAGLCKKNVWNM